MNKLGIIFFILIFITAGFSSCKKNWLGEQTKPKGRGESGEIVLVLDSARWSGNIGSQLRKIFHESVDGLPRDEPMFDLRHITPFQFKGILKHAKNLILVVPINDNSNESLRMRNFFTRDAIDSIRKNPQISLINRNNLFATDQNILFIIGHDNLSLEQKIESNSDNLRSFFNQTEEKRAYKRLYSVRRERLIMNNIQQKYKFQIQVPFGWKIAQQKEDFVWLRQAGDQIDKNIFISSKPYYSESQFNDEQMIEWRNKIAKDHIYENPEKANSYIITEPLDPPIITEVNFDGKYAKKMIGRWKTKNITMGGPFISYVLVNENSNLMYYFEGFVFSPGVEQREIVRELDVILKTFKIITEEQS